MKPIVGRKYQFKNDIELSNGATGKSFTVTHVNEVHDDISIVFDADSRTYHLHFDVWDQAVISCTKWEGSSLTFNFI